MTKNLSASRLGIIAHRTAQSQAEIEIIEVEIFRDAYWSSAVKVRKLTDYCCSFTVKPMTGLADEATVTPGAVPRPERPLRYVAAKGSSGSVSGRS